MTESIQASRGSQGTKEQLKEHYPMNYIGGNDTLDFDRLSVKLSYSDKRTFRFQTHAKGTRFDGKAGTNRDRRRLWSFRVAFVACPGKPRGGYGDARRHLRCKN